MVARNRQHGTYRTARRPQRCRIVRGVYKQQRLTTHVEYYRSAAAVVFTFLPPPVVFVGLLADEITLAPYVYPPSALSALSRLCPHLNSSSAAPDHQQHRHQAAGTTAPFTVSHQTPTSTQQQTRRPVVRRSPTERIDQLKTFSSFYQYCFICENGYQSDSP
ncbi:hypothetical protein ACI65C_003062 [Semiaphis heraclei]